MKEFLRNSPDALRKTFNCPKCDSKRIDRFALLITAMLWLLDNPREKTLFDEEIEKWHKAAIEILKEN